MIATANTIFIHGVPRSGTSWLGQIINSSPNVAFRFQPLFSYAFKDRLGANSTTEEIALFLKEISNSSDDFLHQIEQVNIGAYPSFFKNIDSTHLAIKHVRYHHILENLILCLKDVKIIGIVRHPCSVVNSWIRAPREFHPEWSVTEEWRDAPSKNLSRVEEFYGFTKWQEVALSFLRLSRIYPDNFKLVTYSNLNTHTLETVDEIFQFCNLPLAEQTEEFISKSRLSSHPHVNAVFRNCNNNRKWLTQLDPDVSAKIISETKTTELVRFLHPEDY